MTENKDKVALLESQLKEVKVNIQVLLIQWDPFIIESLKAALLWRFSSFEAKQ